MKQELVSLSGHEIPQPHVQYPHKIAELMKNATKYLHKEKAIIILKKWLHFYILHKLIFIALHAGLFSFTDRKCLGGLK